MIVVLDTSVLVAASVPAPGGGARGAHEESARLLSLLQKGAAEGAVTPKVVREARRVIARAAEDALGPAPRARVDEFTAQCGARLEEYLAGVEERACDEAAVREAAAEVLQMSRDLRRERPRYVGKRLADAGPLLRGRGWGGARAAAVQALKANASRERAQLDRFASKGNKGDMRILAEAVAVKRSVGIPVEIASRDTGFFIPSGRAGAVKSDRVTSEIARRFGVECRSPGDMAERLRAGS